MNDVSCSIVSALLLLDARSKPPDAQTSIATILVCALCGACLSTTWNAFSIVPTYFSSVWTPTISNEMHFWHSVPLPFVVFLVRAVDDWMCKHIGCRLWTVLLSMLSFFGNAAVLAGWRFWSLNIRVGINGIFAVVGACTALGWMIFLLLLPRLHPKSTIAFCMGLWSSSFITTLVQQACGYNTVRQMGTSADIYWITMAAFTGCGFFGVFALVLTSECSAAIDKKELELSDEYLYSPKQPIQQYERPVDTEMQQRFSPISPLSISYLDTRSYISEQPSIMVPKLQFSPTHSQYLDVAPYVSNIVQSRPLHPSDILHSYSDVFITPKPRQLQLQQHALSYTVIQPQQQQQQQNPAPIIPQSRMSPILPQGSQSASLSLLTTPGNLCTCRTFSVAGVHHPTCAIRLPPLRTTTVAESVPQQQPSPPLSPVATRFHPRGTTTSTTTATTATTTATVVAPTDPSWRFSHVAQAALLPCLCAYMSSACTILMFVHFPYVSVCRPFFDNVLAETSTVSAAIGQFIAMYILKGPTHWVYLVTVSAARCGALVFFFFYMNSDFNLQDIGFAAYVSFMSILLGIFMFHCFHAADRKFPANTDARILLRSVVSVCAVLGVWSANLIAYLLAWYYWDTYSFVLAAARGC